MRETTLIRIDNPSRKELNKLRKVIEKELGFGLSYSDTVMYLVSYFRKSNTFLGNNKRRESK
jgi:hypothetical protein